MLLSVSQTPLPSNRQHLSTGNCVEDNGEHYYNCSVQSAVYHNCTQSYAHSWVHSNERPSGSLGLGLGFSFMFLCVFACLFFN